MRVNFLDTTRRRTVTTTNQTNAHPESEPENVGSIICRFRSAIYRLRLAATDLECAEFVEKCHSRAEAVMQEATNDLEKVYEDLRAWRMCTTTKAPKAVQS